MVKLKYDKNISPPGYLPGPVSLIAALLYLKDIRLIARKILALFLRNFECAFSCQSLERFFKERKKHGK